MKCKSLVSLLLVFIILFSLPMRVYADNIEIPRDKNAINVFVRGFSQAEGSSIGTSIRNAKRYKTVKSHKVDFGGVSPVIINGRTYVPIRAVAELLGYDVSWDDASKTVTLSTNISSYTYDDVAQYKALIDLLDALISDDPHSLSSEYPHFSSPKLKYETSLDNLLSMHSNFYVCISLAINDKKAQLNVYDKHKSASSLLISVNHTSDSAAVLKDNRTLLPLRTVAELMGLIVNWDDSSKSVFIDCEAIY